jgi:hypothetical protein
VVSLIRALEGQVIQEDGSRVRFDLNGVSLNIQVKAVRDFLLNSGIER